MPNIALTDVFLAYGDRVLLNNVGLTLNENTKAALAGVNGAGKTTLMRILAGQQHPDEGQYFCPADWHVGYMSQGAPVDVSHSAYQEAEKAYAPWFAIEQKIASLDAQGSAEALEQRALLHDDIVRSGFYERQGLIDATLRGLGFSLEKFHIPLAQLSSGWRMRAALARILLGKADFLLLDEPSNYLDIQASDWLIDWLKRFSGGYLIVSHDRHFLDETTRETFELFCGKLKRYVGSYTQYEQKRLQELDTLIDQKKQQDERRQQLQDFIDKFRYNASKASLVQSRIKELEKMQEIKLPENLQKVSFRIPSPPPCGERVVYMEGVSKQYDGKTIFSDLTFLVNKGEKLALIGDNGAGKSTLMRMLSGLDRDFSGYIKLGSGVKVGYFSEETHDPLTAKTVLQEVENATPLAMQEKVRDLLATFLFAGDAVYKPIAGLSGGERARLLLLKTFLKPFNLLLLDEPTNHLDIATKDVLLQALQEYAGTVIFVSHDRYFLEKLSQCVLCMQAKPRYYPGDYIYALEQMHKFPMQTQKQKNLATPTISENQRLREESKKKAAEQKRKQRQEAQLLQQIAACEDQQKQYEQQLAQPEVYTYGEKVKELKQNMADLATKIADLYAQWEDL